MGKEKKKQKVEENPILAQVKHSLQSLEGKTIDNKNITMHPKTEKLMSVTFPSKEEYTVTLGPKPDVTGEPQSLLISFKYDAIFGEKEELDFVYFWRKQLLMARIMEPFSNSKCIDQLNAVYELSGLVIKLRFEVPESFKYYRLAPGRGNIHIMEEFHNKPTPEYNSMVLEDLLTQELDIELDEDQQEAVKMLKAWYFKMGFQEYVRFPTVDAFIALFVNYLKTNSLENADALQLIKGFLAFLNMKNRAEPIFINEFKDYKQFPREYKDCFSLQMFTSNFECVFVDKSGMLNLFHSVSLSSMVLLSHFAKRLLDNLTAKIPVSFESLFIERSHSLCSYDLVIEFELTSNDTSVVTSTEKKVFAVIQKALGDRVKYFCISRSDQAVKLNLILNPENCFRLATMGPTPDLTVEVESFRRLWGAKAELRKFDAGVVRCAVAWPELSEKRHMIVPQAVKHLLAHHKLIASGSRIKHQADSLDFILPNPSMQKHQKPFSYFTEAFEALAGMIRSCSVLPLSVTQVVPISDCLRYTAFMPCTVEQRVAGPASPIVESLLVFERSAKWPNDLQALRAAKHAFLLQLMRFLEKSSLPCSLDAQNDYLDVFFKSLVFRFHIRLEKQIRLLEAEGLKEKAKELGHLYNERPLLHAKLHSLATSNVVFGPTVRMVKRWLSAQMFSFIPDDLVETICGIVFAKQNPNSVLSAFYQCVKYLSMHQYNVPFVFDPDNQLDDGATLRDIQKDCSLTFYCAFLKDGKYNLPSWRIDEKTWKLLNKVATACLLMFDESGDSVDMRELLNPVLLESKLISSIPVPASNSVLHQSMKRQPEFLDKLVRTKSGCMADFTRSLPGLLIIESLAKHYSSEAIIFYDKYLGTLIGVHKGVTLTDFSQ